MKWNAFELITPAIEKTKKRVLPFSFKEWFKLGIIATLASSQKFSGNFSGNFSNFNNDSLNSMPALSFEEFKNRAKEYVGRYWMIGALVLGFIFILGAIWSYINSVFNFIFIESVLNKQAKFTFRKNNPRGISLFLFSLVFSILNLIVIAAIAYPYVSHFMRGNPILASVGMPYIIFSIIFLVIYFIIIWFLLLFVSDFVTAHMYSKNFSAWFSWRQIWRDIGKNKKETFVYWIARLLISIVMGLIFIFIALLLIIVLLLIAGLLFLLWFVFYSLLGGSTGVIILGIIFLIILVLVFFLAILILAVPFVVFSKYFHLLNFEQLTGIKILSLKTSSDFSMKGGEK